MKLKFLFLPVFFSFLIVLAAAQDVPEKTTPSKSYLLGPGDEVTAKVSGESDYDFVAIVNEDGKIEVPFYDKPIVAKCRTEAQLGDEVKTLLSKYLRNPLLTLRVTARKSRAPATIYGEVNLPAQVELHRKATLLEMISVAGGVKEEAGGTIQVFRTTPPLCGEGGEDSNWKPDPANPTDVPSRIYSLSSLKLGKEESNPVIMPGDVIYVHRALPVYVTGEVVAPQGIYLKEGGLSLTEAIAKLGGVRPGAKTRDIKVYRLKANGDPNSPRDREVLTANYDMIRKGQQKDIMLRENDWVEVDKAKESVAVQILRFAVGAGKAVITSGANNIGYRVVY